VEGPHNGGFEIRKRKRWKKRGDEGAKRTNKTERSEEPSLVSRSD